MAQIEQAPITMSYPESGGKMAAIQTSRRMVSGVRAPELAKRAKIPQFAPVPTTAQIAEKYLPKIGEAGAELAEKLDRKSVV
jgi:hypothetical protein